MSGEDHAKALAFLHYMRACALARHNRLNLRPHLAAVNERIGRRLVGEYPDFPEAYAERFPRRAEEAITL